MADVLGGLLADCHGCPLDIATAYFSISGYRLVKDGLHGLGAFRLLIGAEPHTGADIGLRPNRRALLARMRGELEAEPFDEATLRLVEDLIAFLRTEKVQVRLFEESFLHAKAYLFHQDRVGPANRDDRLRPYAAIVGSSNFTAPGLTSNRELNVVHRVFSEKDEPFDVEAAEKIGYLREKLQYPTETILDPSGADIRPEARLAIKSEVGGRAISDLQEWFSRQWAASADFKDQLIELLNTSKFGQYEYTPYQVYLKALYEYLRDQLGPETDLFGRSAVELTEFQDDAVKKARRILGRYDGCLIADSVGLGKTHLVQAIAHTLLSKHPRPKILYMSCENFMNQFISAVRHGDIESFRYRYRHLDVLLIDDIHFLGKGDRTQEEFFHTFNALYNAQKQIVITSDSSPKEIPAIEERLISRFKWGMVTKLSQPSYETRVAIIQKKAQLKGRTFPEDVVNYIAEHIASNIREIEGAIIKIIGYASLMNKQIDLLLAKDALLDTIDRERTTISIEDTQNAVVKYFKIKLSDLQSKRRSRAISHPRQVCMYLARKLTGYSLEEIGGYFGGRDHTTVMHACEKIENLRVSDSLLAATIEKLTDELHKSVSKGR